MGAGLTSVFGLTTFLGAVACVVFLVAGGDGLLCVIAGDTKKSVAQKKARLELSNFFIVS